MNPYSEMLLLMQKAGKQMIPMSGIGKVLSVIPLTVKYKELQLDKDDFLIANGLISSLEIGDDVVIIPLEGNEEFVILSKVVRL